MPQQYIDVNKLKAEFPVRLNHRDEEHGDLNFVLGIEAVFDYIDEMPAADVQEVRHGQWLRNDYTHKYMCSECGRDVETTEQVVRMFPYCNCGAKMDLEG